MGERNPNRAAGIGEPVRGGRVALKLALLVLLTATVAEPSRAAPISAKDARGRIITLSSVPKRIVSLAPAVTEILFAVGAGPRVVGVTSYCDYPAEAKRVPKIGDFRASVEKVIARKPDLIVASASANAQVIPQLERLRIPLFVVDTQTVTQVMDSILGVGHITGAEPGAARVVRSMHERIASVRGSVSRAKSRPRVLVVVDVSGPWVAGRGNYMDDLVSMAGGINIARDAGPGWPRYSAEKAIVGKPDVMLVTDRHAPRIGQVPGWSRLPAVAKNRVYSDLPISFVRPGPRLPDALESVARILHPQLFGPRK